MPLTRHPHTSDIMGRGSYPYYPEAMLTCGRLPVPRATGNEPALLRDLGIYMRAKVSCPSHTYTHAHPP